ncbi:hypothetical protein ADK64_37765 [Streptomyces sp. MMG1121]|nr:hypothetical protein ADK64_37765 [Streptomyces sp. MMG1121]
MSSNESVGNGRTIAVLGGGAAGLSFAREVESVGHHAIVLEVSGTVGGPCATEVIDGRFYDICGRICGNGYRRVGALIRDYGLTTEPSPVFKYNRGSKSAVRMAVVGEQHALLARYAEFQRYEFPRIGEPGLHHSGALSMSARDWLAERGLDGLFETVGACFTAGGFGALDDALPALYFAKVAAYYFTSSPGPFGHRAPFTVTGGFWQLWDRMAADLSDVRCGVEVLSVDRSGPCIRIHTSAGSVTADDLVITIPVDQALPLLDASEDEREIAARVRRLDYCTTMCRVSGLPRPGTFIIGEPLQNPVPPGQLVAWRSQYADTDWTVCYSYGSKSLGPAESVELLRNEIERIGGRLLEVRNHRHWSRMPHFSGSDIADGIYERIEKNQGRQNTYLVGSLPSFELNECNVSYAQWVAKRFFGAATERRE